MSVPRMWDMFGAEHLPYRLLLLSRMIDRQASRHLSAAFDLTLAEWRVLAFVCASGPASASTIGRSGGIDRAEISRAVTRLEAKGHIVREMEPANRRKLTISPTVQGTELFGRAIADRRALYHDLLEDIDDADRAVVERALRRMVERIRELDPEQ